MKVKVVRRSRDWEENLKLREVGEIFGVNKDRAEELKRKELVEEVPETRKDEEGSRLGCSFYAPNTTRAKKVRG